MMNKVELTRAAAIKVLSDAKITCPPIPVERLAHRLGAELRLEPFDGNLSGLLYREAGQAIIGVNSLHAKTRQRFTIAHEIGHLLLHQQDLFIDRDFRIHQRNELSTQGFDLDEIMANAFAAELLMPIHLLEADLHGHAVDYEDDEFLRQLAKRYRVSLQAMVFRLINLGLIDQSTQLLG